MEIEIVQAIFQIIQELKVLWYDHANCWFITFHALGHNVERLPKMNGSGKKFIIPDKFKIKLMDDLPRFPYWDHEFASTQLGSCWAPWNNLGASDSCAKTFPLQNLESYHLLTSGQSPGCNLKSENNEIEGKKSEQFECLNLPREHTKLFDGSYIWCSIKYHKPKWGIHNQTLLNSWSFETLAGM